MMATFTTPASVFDPTFRERVRDANPLETVVNEELLAAGHPPLAGRGDELEGWHPAHGSQSGLSLKVNIAKQVYICFNCGEAGDIFSWVMQDRRCTFVDALHFLANRAGISGPTLDPAQQVQWQQLQQERHDLEELFRVAVEFFHQQLAQEHIDFCKTQWGLTHETVQHYNLGFAPVAPDALQQYLRAQHFAEDAIQKSGLVIYAGGQWHDFFQGRIIFPYWRDLPHAFSGLPGTPVYFIGRRMEGMTPDVAWEKAKYRKQLVHGLKHPYVSHTVLNTYFYGEHALRGLKDRPVLVTEGVADCLVALQADMPTISPVTVRFSKACYPRLLQLARPAQRIIICNDNEDSKAGLKGALATAAFLDAEGVDVRLVTLPRPDGVSKVDLADFLKSHTAEAFQHLCDQAPAYLDARLATYPVSTDAFTNCTTARHFVTEVLHPCPDEAKALAFLRHRVKEYFKLHNPDIDDLMKIYHAPKRQTTTLTTTTPSTAGTQAPSAGPTPSWRGSLLLTRDGDPRECAGNFSLYLENHPHLAGRLWWDAVRNRPMRDNERLTDEHITELAAWLGTVERLPVRTLRLLERCAHAIAYRTQRDPLQEWLSSLPPWDGIPNLNTWFPLVTGAMVTPYHRWLGRALITSMVARALDPGCIQPYVVILEGHESKSKSALVQALAPDHYTTLSMDLASKEAFIQIQGAWVVELMELDSLSRSQESRIKAFITMRTDDYVPKFSNSPMSYKRRAIFVGTTNESQYLIGQTGNTRFFPVWTETIDLTLFENLRETLFAEALDFYQAHPKDWWEIPPDVAIELEAAREQRRIDTPFEEIIGTWLATQTGTQFTWVEIAKGALGITDLERLKDKALQMQVATAMRQHGFTRKTTKGLGNKTLKVWTK